MRPRIPFLVVLLLLLLAPRPARSQDARHEPDFRDMVERAEPTRGCDSVDFIQTFGPPARHPEAAKLLMELSLDPTDPARHNNLGNHFARRGQWEQARRAYECALELDERFPEAWNNLGVLLIGQDEAGEAVEALRQAVAMSPEYALAHYNLAVAYDAAGRYDAALESFQRALTLDPRLGTVEHNPHVAGNSHRIPIFLRQLLQVQRAQQAGLDQTPPSP